MPVSRNILVIDDDQSVGEMFSRTLQMRGYEVFTETQARSGVKKAGEVLPDIVFISLLLDATNGLKVSKEIHSLEKLRKVPVVMLVSYEGELDPRYTLNIGIVDVLVKPLKEREIISVTEAVLGPDTLHPGAEAIIPEPADRGKITGAFQPNEGYLPATEEEDKNILALDARSFGGDETIGDKTLLTRQRTEKTGDVLTGEESCEERSAESCFGRLSSTGDIETDEEQKYSEPLPEEEYLVDEREIRRGDASDLVDQRGVKVLRKKSLIAAAVLALIVAIGIGTFWGLQFFFSVKSEDVAPPQSHELSRKEMNSLRQKITEAPPATNTPQTGADHADGAASGASGAASGDRTEAIFSAQVGYFGNRKNAELLAERMKLKGYRVFLNREEKASGEIFYRVLVGKFSNRAEALEQAEVILRKEDMKSLLYKE
jgi:DNA-binding response OmpR family regulator/cell division septation protein DedD